MAPQPKADVPRGESLGVAFEHLQQPAVLAAPTIQLCQPDRGNMLGHLFIDAREVGVAASEEPEIQALEDARDARRVRGDDGATLPEAEGLRRMNAQGHQYPARCRTGAFLQQVERGCGIDHDRGSRPLLECEPRCLCHDAAEGRTGRTKPTRSKRVG
jgi:hypothetical protein